MWIPGEYRLFNENVHQEVIKTFSMSRQDLGGLPEVTGEVPVRKMKRVCVWHTVYL